MENWTMSDYIVAFRKMWLWISLETRKRKRKVYKHEFLLEEGFEENTICAECFLCHYVSLHSKSGHVHKDDCGLCPVELNCCETNSLYLGWLHCPQEDWERAAELAARMATAPLKKQYA